MDASPAVSTGAPAGPGDSGTPPPSLGSGGGTFDVGTLDEIAKTEKAEAEKVKRTRTKKGLTKQEKEAVFGPLFNFGNMLLRKYGVQELSKEEIETGIEAWAPIAEKYLPMMDKYGIWVAPALWSVGVVSARIDIGHPNIEVDDNARDTGSPER